jgi:hypothetical protein
MRSRSSHQSRPLRSVGVLLEHHRLVAVKPVHVAERGVERRTAVFHRAAIAAEHHHVVAAVNERGRHGREVVNRCQQPPEHTIPHSLRTNLGIAIRERTALRFVPVDG